MSIKEPIQILTIDERAKAKRSALLHTIAYVIAFPVSAGLAIVTATLFVNSHAPLMIKILCVGIGFCVPISVLASIFLMWRDYSRKEHEKLYDHSSLPVFTFAWVCGILFFFQFFAIGS